MAPIAGQMQSSVRTSDEIEVGLYFNLSKSIRIFHNNSKKSMKYDLLIMFVRR